MTRNGWRICVPCRVVFDDLWVCLSRVHYCTDGCTSAPCKVGPQHDMGASFLCICPPKKLQFDQNKYTSEAEISARLSGVAAFQGRGAHQIHAPGAGLVFAPSPDLSVATQASCFAAFKGRLDNYPYLVRKYCARRLERSELPTLNQIKEAAPLSAAEVVCELYATLGTSFLPKLKGDFAFVYFDSKKVRVLAARASIGGIGLWQARGPDAYLCIGSGDCQLQNSTSRLDFQPGFFKYGWYAEPQQFVVATPQSTTTAAASAALKAMEGITMAPKPIEFKRYSSSSGGDMSSQSTDFAFRSSSVTRSSSMTPSAPIAIGSFRESSNDDLLGSSVYTETALEGSGSVTSDASMLTSKTNKTRRGKRGGKKQRESSQKFKMQSLPPSPMPMLLSSSAGSQADRRGWWRSSAYDKDASPLLQAVNTAGGDIPDDTSQGDTMSSMSLGDILVLGIPGNSHRPPSVPGSADEAWGQDLADTTDELQFNLPSNLSGLSGRLPTVVEHLEEGMSRPQSLADLSKAGWTVDNALSRCSSRANIARLARISSFPELATMPEMTISSASSPPSALPGYPTQRQLADLGAQMSAAFSGISKAPSPTPPVAKPASRLNPNAVSFQPGKAKTVADQSISIDSVTQAAPKRQEVSKAGLSSPAASPPLQPAPEVVMGFVLSDINTKSGPSKSTSPEISAQNDNQAAPSMFTLASKTPFAVDCETIGEKADKAVARRLLLKKRVASFNKSKSCNDLFAAEPPSPSRSPLAPLANLAQ